MVFQRHRPDPSSGDWEDEDICAQIDTRYINEITGRKDVLIDEDCSDDYELNYICEKPGNVEEE